MPEEKEKKRSVVVAKEQDDCKLEIRFIVNRIGEIVFFVLQWYFESFKSYFCLLFVLPLELLDGLEDVVGQVHDVARAAHAAAGGGLVGGRLVLLVHALGEEGRDDGEDNVEEGEQPETHDDGEEEVVVERVAHLEVAVHAEAVAHAHAGVEAAKEVEDGSGGQVRLVHGVVLDLLDHPQVGLRGDGGHEVQAVAQGRVQQVDQAQDKEKGHEQTLGVGGRHGGTAVLAQSEEMWGWLSKRSERENVTYPNPERDCMGRWCSP